MVGCILRGRRAGNVVSLEKVLGNGNTAQGPPMVWPSHTIKRKQGTFFDIDQAYHSSHRWRGLQSNPSHRRPCSGKNVRAHKQTGLGESTHNLYFPQDVGTGGTPAWSPEKTLKPPQGAANSRTPHYYCYCWMRHSWYVENGNVVSSEMVTRRKVRRRCGRRQNSQANLKGHARKRTLRDHYDRECPIDGGAVEEECRFSSICIVTERQFRRFPTPSIFGAQAPYGGIVTRRYTVFGVSVPLLFPVCLRV